MVAIESVRYTGRWCGKLGWVLLLWVVFEGCASPTRRGPRLVGNAVSFALVALDGQTVELSDRAGQVVLVDIWATWCAPCVASFPEYAAIYVRHKEAGFSVLAVSVDREDDEVRRFVERHGVPFTILRDPQGSLPERIELRTMPTALLVGRDGKIAFIHEGFVPGDEVALEQRILDLLATPVEPAATSSIGATP